jgi:hypothetical protein
MKDDVVEMEEGKSGGGLKSKISTMLETPVLPNPPPKKILLFDDADARNPRGSERVAVNQMLLVKLNKSTTELAASPSDVPPPKTTISPIDDDARQ